MQTQKIKFKPTSMTNDLLRFQTLNYLYIIFFSCTFLSFFPPNTKRRNQIIRNEFHVDLCSLCSDFERRKKSLAVKVPDST